MEKIFCFDDHGYCGIVLVGGAIVVKIKIAKAYDSIARLVDGEYPSHPEWTEEAFVAFQTRKLDNILFMVR